MCWREFYLQQVCWEHVVPVTVVKGQGGGETWHGDPLLHTCTDYPTPRVLQNTTHVYILNKTHSTCVNPHVYSQTSL